MLPVVAVPGVSKTFDESGNMTNERTMKSLTGLGARLAKTIVSLRSDPKGGSSKP